MTLIYLVLPSPLPFDALNEGDSLELSGSGKLEWLGYNAVQVPDDRLSRLGTLHQRDRHTDSHVAIANAAPTYCVGQQKKSALINPR